MQTLLRRFFVILTLLTPLVLCLCSGRAPAQQIEVLDTEGRAEIFRNTAILVQAPRLGDLNTDALQDIFTNTAIRIGSGKQASPPHPLGAEILSPDARKLLDQLDESRPDEANTYRVRDLLARLQKLQATYTITGRLDEASVLRDSIEEFLTRGAGVEPDPGNLTAFREQIGQTHLFRVIGRSNGPVWGNQVYTDDSDLGTAAVHAGLLREGQRGVVKVTIQPGQDQYDGAESNGIHSSAYATWQGSYVLAPVSALPGSHDGTMPDEGKKIVDTLTRTEDKVESTRIWQGMDSLQTMLEAAQHAQKLDEALAIREGLRALIIKLVGARPDPGNLTSLRGQVGKSYYFVVTGRVTSSIWGSDIYTDDSDLGAAAVHAGLLLEGQTGIVKVTMRMGMDGYSGSESHGVVSGDYGPWQGSYRISAFQLPPRR